MLYFIEFAETPSLNGFLAVFSLDKEIENYAACNQYDCYRDTAFQAEDPAVDDRHVLIGGHLED